VLKACNDFARVVISASNIDEISHMMVFIVVLLQSAGGGTATSPAGRAPPFDRP